MADQEHVRNWACLSAISRWPVRQGQFRPFAPGDADVKAFELLARAVRERRPVTCMYRNHGKQAAQKRTVHPCHIAYIENSWYLFGFDLMREAIRTFALTRLTDLKLRGGTLEGHSCHEGQPPGRRW